MVLPLQKAINSLFERCGQAGTHQGNDILFLLIEPDEVVEIGCVSAMSCTLSARIRVSDAPLLKRGDKIRAETTDYIVNSEPRKDIHGLIWSVDLVCA